MFHGEATFQNLKVPCCVELCTYGGDVDIKVNWVVDEIGETCFEPFKEKWDEMIGNTITKKHVQVFEAIMINLFNKDFK